MTPVNLFAILEDHAGSPGRQAIVTGYREISYPELIERIACLASDLLDRGLDPRGPVGVSIRDEIDHVVAAVALLCLGAPQLNLPSHEAPDTLRALAHRIGVRQVVAADAEPWMDGMRIFTQSGAAIHRPSGAFPAQDVETVVLYRTTSGSTGVPKAFGLSLDRLLWISRRCAERPSERRVLRTSSMEFDSTRIHRICSLIAGNTCVMAQPLATGELPQLCADADVTEVHLGTFKLAELVAVEAHRSMRFPADTRLLTGGSRVSGTLRRRVRDRLTDNLWISYATSEIGAISLASPDQHEAYPEGVGFALPGVSVEIISENGEPAGPGAIGVARVRKSGAPSGYVRDADASTAFRDGWFTTGDLLSLEPGEPLIFHGRADDVMILNGINIYPSAIEDVLEAHPDVREAVAYPVTSRIHGEIPVAAVVLAGAGNGDDVAPLMELCRRSLGIRAPRRIVVVDRIPRNETGKPLRRELRAL
jgi:acyl-CoA synthetase (AMP-forming)/AMP-acid ligase II